MEIIIEQYRWNALHSHSRIQWMLLANRICSFNFNRFWVTSSTNLEMVRTWFANHLVSLISLTFWSITEMCNRKLEFQCFWIKNHLNLIWIWVGNGQKAIQLNLDCGHQGVEHIFDVYCLNGLLSLYLERVVRHQKYINVPLNFKVALAMRQIIKSILIGAHRLNLIHFNLHYDFNGFSI